MQPKSHLVFTGARVYRSQALAGLSNASCNSLESDHRGVYWGKPYVNDKVCLVKCKEVKQVVLLNAIRIALGNY